MVIFADEAWNDLMEEWRGWKLLLGRSCLEVVGLLKSDTARRGREYAMEGSKAAGMSLAWFGEESSFASQLLIGCWQGHSMQSPSLWGLKVGTHLVQADPYYRYDLDEICRGVMTR